jgi:hypothetical protein
VPFDEAGHAEALDGLAMGCGTQLEPKRLLFDEAAD